MDTFVNLCPAFGPVRGRQRTFLRSASCQLPSAQKHPYAKVASLGATYSCYPSSASHVLFSKAFCFSESSFPQYKVPLKFFPEIGWYRGYLNLLISHKAT